jgi:hydrogenase expression/formation protein HypC
MCMSLPGKVLRLNGALAEVEVNGQQLWCNALAQPEVTVGDFVLVHANLIVAIISELEAEQMLQAARELDEALRCERSGDPRSTANGDASSMTIKG